ncbi:MAG: DUF4198 domain-containing protein [Desulfosalsimonadaceae bacterium]
MKKTTMTAVLALCIFCLAGAAQAHMLWLTPDNSSPQPGETVEITVGFGHHYPQGKMEKKDRLQGVFAVSPDGSQTRCENISAATYKFTPEKKGGYWLYAAMKPGFVSRTTEGRKLGNKETLSGVVSCFAFRLSAMTPLRCGGDADWRTFAGDGPELEIFPSDDPGSLSKGDTLRLKVLFQGKPLADASLTPASAAGEEHSGEESVKTNAEGIARVKIDSPGAWIFTASHKRPYTNKELCDFFSYSTSLTLDF